MRPRLCDDDGVTHATFNEKRTKRSPTRESRCGLAAAGGPLPLQAETFAEVSPEPPIEVVDTVAARIKSSGADAVIALGGGSVMEPAKVADAIRPTHRALKLVSACQDRPFAPAGSVRAQPRCRTIRSC